MRLLVQVTIGLAAGSALITTVLYRQALVDVETLLAGPVWSTSGRVRSAPITLRAGLALTPSELAADLQAAGYARVDRVGAPGDFSVVADDVLVSVRADRGPGWTLEPGEIHVAFGGGRVQSVNPKTTVQLAPVILAELRGPENESRIPVTLEQLPPYVPDAVLAMEDARFYDHKGLDPLGILRAVARNVLTDGGLQGGSTLTQQLVKNLFLTQERTFTRKAREAVLAIAIERRHSKDEILALYLNEIYLGQVGGAAICGVAQAARAYFGTAAERLSMGQAATLAGIISAPNAYSPLRHPERALERRDIALGRMASTGAITQAQADAIVAQPLEIHPTFGTRRAPWVVDLAIDKAEDALGEGTIAGRGLTVETTLRPTLQRLAERAVVESVAELEERWKNARGAQMALVAMTVSDGAIVAMVGGRDYPTSQFNRAWYGQRQVGSTIKPLTFLFAFERFPRRNAATRLMDEPITRKLDNRRSWSPKNYDGTYKGRITYRQALSQSRNIPAVLVAEDVGLDILQTRWKEMGLRNATSLPSAALGAFDASPVAVASAYTVFPGAGRQAEPLLIRGVTDGAGETLLTGKPITHTRTGSIPAARAVELLQAVISDGTGKSARRMGVNGPVGGKTGTTDDGRDAWFVGFTPELVVAVWAGRDQGKALGLTGAQAALPAWSRFVAGVGERGTSFSAPRDAETVEICAESGGRATAECPDRWTMLGSDDETAVCDLHEGEAIGAEKVEKKTTRESLIRRLLRRHRD